MTQLLKTVIDKTLMFNSPFSVAQLKDIRMHLLQDIAAKGFSHYVNQMKMLGEEIDKMKDSDADVSDSSYWSKSIFKDPYWQEESPWLYEQYYKPARRRRLFLLQPTGVSTLTSIIFRSGFVKSLIGVGNWMTLAQTLLFEAILGAYYTNNVRLWPVHLNLDYAFKTTKDAGPNSFLNVLKAALSGSGTFILKVLQQVNTANESKVNSDLKVSEIAEDVFAQVPGLTDAETAFLKSHFKLRDMNFVKNMDPKMLGSASLAEAHFTYSGDLQAVLKFVKPLYAYYYLCECNFLMTVGWQRVEKLAREMKDVSVRHQDIYIRQSRRLMMFFVKEFIKEFDYENEFINTTIGYRLYNNPAIRIRSIIAVEYAVNPFPVLILERVNGKSVDSVLRKGGQSKEQLMKLYQDIEGLLTKWITIVLWGSPSFDSIEGNGFFHSDLHPGNVMISSDTGDLWIIDYGSCGVLNPLQQCRMISAMMTSGEFVKPQDYKGEESRLQNLQTSRKFTRMIWSLCEVEDYGIQELELVSQKILESKALSFSSLFLDIIRFSENIGKCNNNAVLLFGRGIAYLGNMMAKIQSLCKQAKGVCPDFWIDNIIRRELIRNHKGQIYNYYTKGQACVPKTPTPLQAFVQTQVPVMATAGQPLAVVG